MTEAKEYIELIDQKYFEAKKNRISRFSVEWGKWSREMNLELRESTKAEAPQSLLLRHVFIYWINRSQLLELYYKGRISSLGKKKRLEKEGAQLKKDILSGKLPKLTTETMKETLLKSAKL
jgi:hypothetical protein